MRTLFFITLSLASLLSCSKETTIIEDTNNLISPQIVASVNDENGESPLTGILEVYPCNNGSSIYFGNYVDGKLTPFNGYYRILT